MFQFRRFPSHTYLIQYGIPFGGFPHSEISGSMLICSSPKLIAAYHVLHRLQEPRHPPYALSYLFDFHLYCYGRCLLKVVLFGKFTFSCSFFIVSFEILKNLLCCPICQRSIRLAFRLGMNVENNGFEPLTPCLQSRCSSQLS